MSHVSGSDSQPSSNVQSEKPSLICAKDGRNPSLLTQSFSCSIIHSEFEAEAETEIFTRRLSSQKEIICSKV